MTYIQKRAEELYPLNDEIDIFEYTTNSVSREAYIKGAEEWYQKGKDEEKRYCNALQSIAKENLDKAIQLAAKVKLLNEELLHHKFVENKEHDQEMKSFAEWIYKEGYEKSIMKIDLWYHPKHAIAPEIKYYTTSELLELFRKSK